MKVLPFSQKGFFYKVNSAVFCVCYDEHGTAWQAIEGDISELSEMERKLSLSFTDKNKCQVKLIYQSKDEVSLKKFEAFKSWTNVKFITRDTSYETYFDNQEKIFRLSKENKKIKLLIVDDSKTILTLLNTIFKTDPEIEIVGSLTNPLEVESYIEKFKPDVMTLDIHMPHMTGVELLKKLKNKFKIPTIMITSLSINEGTLVIEALENGAFDYIQKPKMEEIKSITSVLIEKVKAAAKVNIANLTNSTLNNTKSFLSELKFNGNLNQQLILMGASTGGTNALAEVLKKLPKESPPILIVQHIPPVFSGAFAKRLNDICKFEVRESKEGDVLKPGLAIVAQGGIQVGIKKIGNELKIFHRDDPPVNRFKPSVDYMFNSAAESLLPETIAVILTGMGDDGSRGMLKLKQLGVETIAQDEKTSVVFGMPKEAIKLGAVSFIEPLTDVASRMTQILNQSKKKKAS